MRVTWSRNAPYDEVGFADLLNLIADARSALKYVIAPEVRDRYEMIEEHMGLPWYRRWFHSCVWLDPWSDESWRLASRDADLEDLDQIRTRVEMAGCRNADSITLNDHEIELIRKWAP